MNLQRVIYNVSFWTISHSGSATYSTTVDLDGDYMSELQKDMNSEMEKYNTLGSIIVSAYRDGVEEISLEVTK